MSHWTPALYDRPVYTRRPPVGVIVAMNQQAWLIDGVDDIDPNLWDGAARDAFAADGMPDPWSAAPFRIRAHKVGECGQYEAVIQPGSRVPTWYVLPEHYAVCVTCHTLAPCQSHAAEVHAAEMMRQLEKRMRVLPGCCPACEEPITSRQEKVTFPGTNLLVLTGDPDVTFHVRSRCWSGAARYEEMWVADDPSRPRSLLTLRCEGALYEHADGSVVCVGADHCPDVRAKHTSWSRCYVKETLRISGMKPRAEYTCPYGCTPLDFVARPTRRRRRLTLH